METLVKGDILLRCGHRVIREGWMHDAGDRKRMGLLRDGKGLTRQKPQLGFSTGSLRIRLPGISGILRRRRVGSRRSRKGRWPASPSPSSLRKVMKLPRGRCRPCTRRGTLSPAELGSLGAEKSVSVNLVRLTLVSPATPPPFAPLCPIPLPT